MLAPDTPEGEESRSVLVAAVTYNSSHLLHDFVDSLSAGLRGLRWHLVVADNASSDDSVEELLRLAPHARVLQMHRNAGYAAAVNAAVALSPPHDAVLVLNPDVRLGAGCVQALLSALRQPDVGIAVPRIIDNKGRQVMSLRREPTLLRAAGDALLGARRAARWPLLGEMISGQRYYDRETDADWAEGSVQLISSQCWHRCGPWYEGFFLYSEETEFDLRARDLGFRLRYVPDAAAVHLKGASRDFPELWALLTVNRVRLFRMRNGRARSMAFWAIILTRELTRSALGRATSKAAVRGLFRPAGLLQASGPQSVVT